MLRGYAMNSTSVKNDEELATERIPNKGGSMIGVIAGKTRVARLISLPLAALLSAAPAIVEAQDNSAAPAAPAPAVAAPATPAEQAVSAARFNQEELRKLLAPIALYPDPLLAQMLPASAYPLYIVQLHRWIEQNPQAVAKNDFSAIDKMKWDPAVKALARFPAIVTKMNDDLSWTTDLGDAFVNQPADVSQMIQTLRAEAEKAGNLKSSAQQKIGTVAQEGKNYITIESANPGVVYVPTYDPVQVYQPYYGAAPLWAFGAGVLAGAIWANNWWNWGGGSVNSAYWGGAGAWRAGAGYRAGMGSKPGIGRPGGVGGVGGPGGIGGVGRPGGVGGVGGPGGIGGVGRPGGVGGVGRPGGIGGVGRPGGVGGAGRPGGVGGAGRPGGVGGAGRPGGVGGAGRPGGVGGAGRPGGVGGVGRAGGFGGGGFRGGHGGGFRGGGGGFRGGGGGFRGGGGGFRGGGGGGRRGGGGGGGRRRSDMRLKHDIVLLGRLDDGLGYYSFVYNGGHTAYVGVMAQEVQTVAPEAVTRGADGYMRVSYELLGLPFETYQQWVATGAHLPNVKPVAH